MNTEFNTQNENLQIGEEVKSFFLETAKWAKFISIIGFISLGLMVLAGFSFGSIMSSLPSGLGAMGAMGAVGSGFFIVLYIVVALIYYFPIKYLFDFSTKVKKALELTDQNLFNEAISKLKSHYKYIGIIMIVILSFYILIFIIAILGVIMSSMH